MSRLCGLGRLGLVDWWEVLSSLTAGLDVLEASTVAVMTALFRGSLGLHPAGDGREMLPNDLHRYCW